MDELHIANVERPVLQHGVQFLWITNDSTLWSRKLESLNGDLPMDH